MRNFLCLFLAVPVLAGMLAMPVQARPASTTNNNQRIAATDAQIDATIRTKLAKSKIGKDGFRFHVQRGVVTWEGTTSVVQHKGSATRMAKAAGAVQVVNKIQITADGKTKAASSLKKAYVEQ